MATKYGRELIKYLDILEGKNIIKDGKVIPVKPGIDPADIIARAKKIGKGNGLQFGYEAEYYEKGEKNKKLTKDKIRRMQNDANKIKEKIAHLLPKVECEMYGDKLGKRNVKGLEEMLAFFIVSNHEYDRDWNRRYKTPEEKLAAARRLVGGRIDAGDPNVYKKINKLVHKNLQDIYTSVDTAIIAARDGKGILDGQQGGNTTRGITEESKALRAEVQRKNLHLPKPDLDRFEDLVNKYAMSCVSPMLSCCIDSPDFNEKGEMLGEYGLKERDKGREYDARYEMLREQMNFSVNEPTDDAWQNLQNFLNEKQIKTENLKPKRGSEEISFDGMIGLMTRGYCLGYLQANPSLYRYYDPKKLNNFMPTRINLTCKEKDKDSGKDVERTYETQHDYMKAQADKAVTDDDLKAADPHKRSLAETKKLQQAAEIKGGSYKHTRIPYRGLFKIFARYQKLITMFTSSLQQTGYLLKFMKTLGYNLLDENERPAPTEYDKGVRKDLTTRTNLAFLHAEQVIGRGGDVNEFMDSLLKMDAEIDDDKNKVDDLSAKFSTLRVNGRDGRVVQDNDEQKFDTLVAQYYQRIESGGESEKEKIKCEFYIDGKGLNGFEAQDLITLIERYSKPDIAQYEKRAIKEEQGLLRLLSKYGGSRKERFSKVAETVNIKTIDTAIKVHKEGKDSDAVFTALFSGGRPQELSEEDKAAFIKQLVEKYDVYKEAVRTGNVNDMNAFYEGLEAEIMKKYQAGKEERESKPSVIKEAEGSHGKGLSGLRGFIGE